MKDEAAHIEQTLASMAAQTIRPVSWIIVDDGSRDDTAAIVRKFSNGNLKNLNIRLIQSQRSKARDTGIGEILAFNEGLSAATGLDYDFIVKLDGDLSFDPDYFEQLLEQFSRDHRLGIASGVYLERSGGSWTEVPMPGYHAAGASKTVRKTCFEEIGGFVAAKGWDTVDEIRAITRGWRTTHFPALKMKHWKAEGVAMGLVQTACMHGEVYYRTGGGLFFFILKALGRIGQRPVVIGSLALIYGYLRALLTSGPRLVSDAEARRYRTLLNSRIRERLKRVRRLSPA